MSADAAGGPTLSSADARRNYFLGVWNGAVGTVAYDFIHPDLILGGMVLALATPAFGPGWAFFLVTLVSIINKGGSLLPQLYVSSHLEHHARKRPFYIVLTMVRAIGAVAIIGSLALMAWRLNALTLGAFYAAFLLVSVCMGAGYVITLDMFGRMIRLDRIGAFIGTREVLGNALSLVAGLVIVTPILERCRNSDDPALLAHSYLYLAAIGTTLTVAAMVLLILCREEPGPKAKRRTTMGESLVRGWRWVKRNPDYRAYLWLRIAFRFCDLGMVAFIPYGSQKLSPSGDPAEIVLLGGVLVAIFKTSRVASSALWGWVVDHVSDRACLVGTGVSFAIAPVLVLVAPLMPPLFGVPIPLTSATLTLPLAVYLGAMAVMGAAYQGSIIGGNRFLIGRAPPRRRLSYIGFLNTVTSPLTLAPVAAAGVAALLGMTALFVAIMCGGLLYLFWALRVRSDVPRAASGEKA
jgi:MFS family permease